MEAGAVERVIEPRALGPARRVDGEAIETERAHHARHVEPAAAGIPALHGRAKLFGRPPALDLDRDICRRIERERRDGMSERHASARMGHNGRENNTRVYASAPEKLRRTAQ